jgi:hypothetical protein
VYLCILASSRIPWSRSWWQNPSFLRSVCHSDPLSPMIFILVMDVLGNMIAKAAEEGILQPLARRSLQHRISLYVDSVVLFLRPEAAQTFIWLWIFYTYLVGLPDSRLISKKAVCFPSDVRIGIWKLYNSSFYVQLLIFRVSIWAYHLPLKSWKRAHTTYYWLDGGSITRMEGKFVNKSGEKGKKDHSLLLAWWLQTPSSTFYRWRRLNA